MNPTPVIDMFSGTGELARAVADGLNEFTGFQSFSDNYGPARKYLKARFRNVEISSDFHDQDVPKGSIVSIGAPYRDLSVAGKRAGALDMAVAGGADLIAAENVPGGYRTYLDLDLARWLEVEHSYRTTVSSGGAWEVGAPHRRERIMLVAAKRRFEPRLIKVIRQVAPANLLPTPYVVDRAWGLTPKQRDDVKHRNDNGHGETVASVLSRDLWEEEIRLCQTWERVTNAYAPPTGQTCQFMHWMMGLPYRGLDALGLSVSAQRRLAGNAVVRLQRGLTAINHERNL